MECPKCNADFEINDAVFSARIADHDENEIDLQFYCYSCDELAFYSFINLSELEPNS